MIQTYTQDKLNYTYILIIIIFLLLINSWYFIQFILTDNILI